MVCGGPAIGTVRALEAEWTEDGFVSHKDPKVCADNLKHKQRGLLNITAGTATVYLDKV